MYQLIHNVAPVGDSLFYPNCLFKSVETGEIFNPNKEKVMSLLSISDIDSSKQPDLKIYATEKRVGDYFYFIYNTDNYYHFIYDTLPYLITFLQIRKEKHSPKLLMNYPNQSRGKVYPFVLEFLKLVGIDDIEFVSRDYVYENIYISDSYTFTEDNIPDPKIYKLYEEISELFGTNTLYPKKIYVSRRSHLHNNKENMGTDYTQRRKMENEDQLVDYLVSQGYTEVFPETLNLKEKVQLFRGATHIVGPIGGGMVNVLFSLPSSKIMTIVSPGFLSVNHRFMHCMNNSELNLFYNTKHTESTEFKTNMRIYTGIGGIVGEITSINNDRVNVKYSTEKVAGWNNEVQYLTTTLSTKDCMKLDNGLNSPYEINLEKFKEWYGSICNLR